MSVLCIGSSVIDITAIPIPAEKLWQEKQKLRQILMLPGGDAVNQSIVLSRMHQDARLVTVVGDDSTGGQLLAMLREQGVNTESVAIRRNQLTGTALVLVSPEGERHVFAVEAAFESLSAEDLPSLDGAEAVTLASLFQMDRLEKNGLREYLAEARRRGIPVFADLGPDHAHQGLDGIRSLLPEIDYFLPSLGDAMELTGAADAAGAAAVFRSAGAGNVVIKCGGDGCFYSAESIPAEKQGDCRTEETRREEGWIPAEPVIPVDTCGAGDTMVAVFITEILAGRSVPDACRRACRLASLSTLYPGASANLPADFAES